MISIHYVDVAFIGRVYSTNSVMQRIFSSSLDASDKQAHPSMTSTGSENQFHEEKTLNDAKEIK